MAPKRWFWRHLGATLCLVPKRKDGPRPTRPAHPRRVAPRAHRRRRESGLIVVKVHNTTPTPHCPQCDTPAGRTRSTSTRTLADLPWGGWRVVWRLCVRRCPCPWQRIFAERFETLAVPSARRTSRLAEALRGIELALAGGRSRGAADTRSSWVSTSGRVGAGAGHRRPGVPPGADLRHHPR
ncbi:transposase family protein [Deinococcus planocerae]|uniref:transposase family protein n=1 Tax=Deinococcus planocerae TaxID=1737569 RepID=UPI003CCC2E2B